MKYKEGTISEHSFLLLFRRGKQASVKTYANCGFELVTGNVKID